MTRQHGKRVAIVQSCYIPWKGYFDLINTADEFVLYDDRQFTRRDWRNRNRIKTSRGTQWLTLPVLIRGRYHQRIDETEISDAEWGRTHWKTLVHNYARAPHFAEQRERFEAIYLGCRQTRLSAINRTFLEAICKALTIKTQLSWSTDYEATGDRSERLVSLCRATGATTYLSGPSARSYLDEELFAKEGIELEYMDYSGYAEYSQLHPPFVHEVTVLDLLFNVGADAPRFLKTLVAGRS